MFKDILSSSFIVVLLVYYMAGLLSKIVEEVARHFSIHYIYTLWTIKNCILSKPWVNCTGWPKQVKATIYRIKSFFFKVIDAIFVIHWVYALCTRLRIASFYERSLKKIEEITMSQNPPKLPYLTEVSSEANVQNWWLNYSLFQNTRQTSFLRIISKLLDRSASFIYQIVEKKKT